MNENQTIHEPNSVPDGDQRQQMLHLVQRQNSARTANEICKSCAPHQIALLSMFGLAHCRNLDLGNLLDQLGHEAPNRHKAAIKQLSTAVRAGDSPLSSLHHQSNLLPSSVLATLQIAEKDNTLSLLYKHILDRHSTPLSIPTDERQQMLWVLLRQSLIYLMAFSIFTFMCIQILPELKDMHEEFGLEQAAILDLLGVFADWLAVPILVSLGLALILSPILVRYLSYALRGWNPHNWQTPTMTAGTEKRKLLARLAHSEHELSDQTGNQTGLSIPNPSPTTIQFIARAESQAINAAASSETKSWLLNRMADRYEQVSNQRSIRVLKTVLGIANILLGLFVLIAAAATFSVLNSMIEGLNQ